MAGGGIESSIQPPLLLLPLLQQHNSNNNNSSYSYCRILSGEDHWRISVCFHCPDSIVGAGASGVYPPVGKLHAVLIYSPQDGRTAIYLQKGLLVSGCWRTALCGFCLLIDISYSPTIVGVTGDEDFLNADGGYSGYSTQIKSILRSGRMSTMSNHLDS